MSAINFLGNVSTGAYVAVGLVAVTALGVLASKVVQACRGKKANAATASKAVAATVVQTSVSLDARAAAQAKQKAEFIEGAEARAKRAMDSAHKAIAEAERFKKTLEQLQQLASAGKVTCEEVDRANAEFVLARGRATEALKKAEVARMAATRAKE